MLSDVLKYIGVALYSRLSFQSSEDGREIKHKYLKRTVLQGGVLKQLDGPIKL